MYMKCIWPWLVLADCYIFLYLVCVIASSMAKNHFIQSFTSLDHRENMLVFADLCLNDVGEKMVPKNVHIDVWH